ncbi:tetratricopeptide repeat protein [Lysobacter terrae]
MTSTSSRSTVLAAAVAAVLALGAIPSANAQSASERAQQRREEREAKKAAKEGTKPAAAEQYPNATRKVDSKASAKASPKLQKMVKLYDDDKGAEARAIADEIIANTAFNPYDHAFAAQLAGQIAYEANETPAALDYWNKALEFNGLDNNAHYNLMYTVAQIQLQEEKYTEALATYARLEKETSTQKPEHMLVKGNALFRLDRFPEAIAVLKQVLAANPEGATLTNAQQLLMASYAESNQPAEASKLAEAIAAKAPNDPNAQFNLANTLYNVEQYGKAAEVLEKLRAAGQFKEEKNYKILIASYSQMDGKEKQIIDVVNDGLKKGVLKPDFNSYVALAQSYYYSDQPGPAIDAFRKAAPLDDDGETYLNLARLLWQEERIPEAKEAAKQAIAKGLKKPEDAKKILALPAK